MIAIVLCAAAFIITAWAAYHSLARGLLALLSVGYVYGIARANLPTAASHFLFDASVLGLYVTQSWSRKRREAYGTSDVALWTAVLIVWPVATCLMPFQPFLITLVGLRGNIFFLPLLLLGTRLTTKDVFSLAYGTAVLNLLALAIGILEYFRGIEHFFPRNAVTLIMYASDDVAGHAFRIPSFFSSAHAYGGAMVMTLPWLFGAWTQNNQARSKRLILSLGILAALLGILLSATRSHFVIAAALVVIATFTSNISVTKRLAWGGLLTCVVVIAAGNIRLQRFTSLEDTEMVTQRVDGSVNQSFWNILYSHPFGNGLGGGGTSIPYFLQDQVKEPLLMENEYARIVAEQGVIGLLIWLAFIVWHLQRRSAFHKNPWLSGRRLAWWACTMYFGTALIGTGLLTAIPQTPMLLLLLGWISVYLRWPEGKQNRTNACSEFSKQSSALPLPV
jgi:hypothetical protein